jgi:hypothetical protein
MVIPRCFGTTTTLPPAKSRQKLAGTSSRNVLLFLNDENNDGRGSALHAGQWVRIDANRRRPSENCATEALRSTGRSLFESIIGGRISICVGWSFSSLAWMEREPCSSSHTESVRNLCMSLFGRERLVIPDPKALAAGIVSHWTVGAQLA